MNNDRNIEHIVRGIIIHDDKILLCKSLKHGYFYLPGGHIEKGELSAQALKREILEEVGKVAKNVQHVTDIENKFIEDGAEHNEIVNMCLSDLDDYENIKSLESHISFQWMPITELDSIDLKQGKVIIDIIKNRSLFSNQ